MAIGTTKSRSRTREDLRAAEAAKYDRDYYESHYWAEDLPGKSGNMGLSYDDPDHSLRFSLLADILVNNLQFNRFLDAGCGLGGVVKRLHSRCSIAVGCDISAYAIKKCEESGLSCEVAGLHSLPYPTRAFDMVFCSDVLEHVIVEDVFDAVSELTRVTRHHLVMTINTNNPYYFHPTILSRSTWLSLFLRSNQLTHDQRAEDALADASRARPEYEWFCLRRVGE